MLDNYLENLRNQVKQEFESSLIIDELERKFWLDNLNQLPQPTLENLLKILKPKNEAVNKMIETALSQDQNQEHLTKIKQEFANIKKEAFKIEEKGESSQEKTVQAKLLEELENL